ncbi:MULTISPECIES: helix-turn-helix domain-containing protein [Streptomyces]|uniref:Helix-turn-helix domain-containing protein n=1 Tax=Streptomyces siderophoricus TaxID=2802281 RepID=A0ABS1MTA3_9ACTN|nr:helix-turn-helix domain-containing protein [Streptomyces sp. 9-7]MBL1091007.1 helix-turn-helix domain-containing protein [Streptomyces sp. 9-7]
MSTARNASPLAQPGDPRADGGDEQLAALTELVVHSLCERNPGFREFLERNDGAQVTRLIADVLRTGRPLPATVRAVRLATATDLHLVAAALGDCLVSLPDEAPGLLIPGALAEGEEGRARLKGILRHRAAAVGHAVPPQDAAASVRAASRLLDLAARCDGPAAGVAFVDDHLSSLLLLQDESLTRTLIARRLRPLAGLSPERCARLEATLLAWLGGMGAPEVAKALSIHPQTVRYRMRQLEKLFGARLRDPRTRFEIELALRGRRLMAGAHRRRTAASRRPRPSRLRQPVPRP